MVGGITITGGGGGRLPAGLRRKCVRSKSRRPGASKERPWPTHRHSYARLLAICLFTLPELGALCQTGQKAVSTGAQQGVSSVAGKPAQAVPANVESSAACPKSESAQVSYGDGRLSIVAACSNLKRLLNQIHVEMNIPFDGSVGDENVSGAFGPAMARDVIESLLRQAGYSYILVGDGTRYSLTSVIISGKVKAADEAAGDQAQSPSLSQNDSQIQPSSDAGAPAAPAAADIAAQNPQPAAPVTPSADGSPNVGGNPDSSSVQQSHDQLRSLKQQQSQQQNSAPQ